MSSSGLTASSLKPSLSFNWVFLIELLTCSILTLFFLFYFNRLFATCISFGIRAWTWHKYRVYIDINALQLSFLGGRIFFKGVRYHGNNETLFIHSGHITWQYWLRKVREVDLKNGGPTVRASSSSDSERPKSRRRSAVGVTEEGGASTANSDLPCRLSISVKGVEWFVYNRSAAYDAIVANMTGETDANVKSISPKHQETAEYTTRLRKRGRNSQSEKDTVLEPSSSGDSLSSIHPPLTEKSTFATEFTQTQTTGLSDATRLPKAEGSDDVEQSMFLQFLPVYINCRNAAVVLGNENTRSVLITKVDRASGEIDATATRSSDQYKQVINFKFEHPVVQIKPNDDFKEDQTDAAIRVKEGISDEAPVEETQHSHSFWHRRRRKVWHKLQDLVPYFRSSVESFDSDEYEEQNTTREQRFSNAHQWRGLSRYLEEAERDDHAKWSAIEYATVTTIVDCPSASMCFYWDVPGNIPRKTNVSALAFAEATDDINGETPPDWGIDFSIKGAIINYGPWADRQRADLQKVFFPSLCKDAVPAEKLQPGQPRVPTEFKLYLELEEEATLRVPIREGSKNWKWKKQADTMGQASGAQENQQAKGTWRNKRSDKNSPSPEVRPFGWIDVKVGANTSITYVMDMVASGTGFSNKLELDLPSTEITTSVNHGLLWRSVGEKLSCDLSNPLEWNGLRTWQFDITSKGLELFILREHVFLLIDLVDDWAGGPPPDFLTFCPFRYLVNLRLEDFRIYLNVNDSNIINNPSDFDDNTFIIIFGALLTAKQVIPLDKYRPLQNEISFEVEADTGGLTLHVPPWNTQATFLNSTEIAKLDELEIRGTYQYNSTTSTANTDSLLLDVYGKSPSAQFFGFVVRYYLKIKDNYFGEDIHFKTLDEYQQLLNAKKGGEETELAATPPPKKSNDLDVILSISSDDATVFLPASLYTPKNHVRIDIANLGADLRFTNYYMDLQVNLSTLAFSLSGEQDGNTTPHSTMSSTQLFIDGVNAYGHRLFGLPPAEPTYVCNWDFDVGAITGECSTEFIGCLAAGGRCFGFCFDDDENALPSISEVVLKDVTFLRASIQPIKIWLHVDEAALLISTDTITANFDDWAGSHFSQKLKAEIPNLIIACVDSESASRHRSRSQYPVETHAYFKTTIDLNQIGRKLDFEKERDLQQQHIKFHDRRTLRAGFLLHSVSTVVDDSSIDPPAMCFPPMPLPLESDKPVSETKSSMFSLSTGYASRTSSYRRKSSFLSAGSSIHSDRSVVRPLFGTQVPSTMSTLHPGPSPSRSRSRHPGHRSSAMHRDVSVSTGKESSFYSATGDHDDRRGLPPSSVAFSSSYVSPYFPLEAVEPDSQDVPSIPDHLLEDDKPSEDDIKLDDIDPRRYDQSAVHNSFIIRTSDGIVGCFKPEAVRSISQLLESLQPHDPTQILDDLHINAMQNIFKRDTQKITSSKISDVRVCIPALHIRFLNPASSQPTTNSRYENDQYDFQLTGFDATARSRTSVGNKAMPETIKESSSAHLRLRSINLSAKERFDNVTSTQAAVYCGIDDFAFWTVNDDIVRASTNLKRIEVATASNKIEYLATLLHRSNVLATEMGDLFTTASERQNQRFKTFIYRLTKAGHQTSDPPFLTRPSYVLRSADQHLRMSDSWKVVSRLRYMYTSLEASERRALDMLSMADPEDCPHDARTQVIGMLDQWRSWDLNHLDNCVVMKAVYGTQESSSAGESSSKPLDISVRCGTINLILDPGPKQNEITLKSITIQVDADLDPKSTVTRDSTSSASEPNVESVAAIQVYCVDVGINLNWELCELIDDIMILYLEHEERSKPKPLKLVEYLNEQPPQVSALPQRIHVLVVTEKGSITVDTINVKIVSVSKGLKASVTSMSGAGIKTSNSILLNAEAATTKIRSRSQELTLSQLRHPSIYVSHEEQNDNQDFDTNIFKITGNCQELSYVVRQDTLAIIEVVNLVISDEVAQLHRLIQSIPKKTGPLSPVSPVYEAPLSKPKSKNLVNVALFLDMYHISVPLLQSLTYNISGVVARASVAARPDSGIIFDFDIKEHAHDIQTRNHKGNRSISLVQMSPTNGRITTRTTEYENEVCAFVSIEPIELDASAIHSLLTAVNRPEISSVVSQMKEDIAGLKGSIEEIFGGPESPRVTVAPEPSKQLVYRAHMSLAGLNIFVNAPGAKGSSDSARVSLDFGRIHLEVANRLEEHGPLLPYPEVNLALRHMLFELTRVQNNRGERSGSLSFGAVLSATSKKNQMGEDIRSYHIKSDGLEINLFSDTAPAVLDIMAHLQDRIKDLDFSRERRYLRKLSRAPPKISISEADDLSDDGADTSTTLFASQYSLELLKIQISWIVATQPQEHGDRENEDLVLSFERIDLSTRKENSARLTIENLQLQMVPRSQMKTQRSQNSALLPEVVFNVAYVSNLDSRRLAFQVAGKSLDLRLTSQFIIPAAELQKSIGSATDKVRAATATWTTPSSGGPPQAQRQPFLGNKRMSSLLVDADFAGAVVYLQGKKVQSTAPGIAGIRPSRVPQEGRYGQFNRDNANSSTTLRAPGLAWKIEYSDNGIDEPSLNAEVKVDASSNTLYPTVVPLIMEISATVKEVVSDDQPEGKPKEKLPVPKASPQKFMTTDEDNILTADPSAVLGKTRLNLGLRICRQEFSLSCQPIARVAATMRFDDIYMTVNTVRSVEQGNFFAISAAFTKLQASVQHVYSRESTGSFDVDSIVLSLMNSKHVSGTSGLSAILKISPMKVLVNAKQLQDFLLFREIWIPPEIRRNSPSAPSPEATAAQSQTFLVQRYQQVAATGAFPWNATVSIAELDVQLDLGQAIGKSAFMISNFWISSKKNSDWEQNLCLGFDKVGVDSSGRMSGFVALEDFKVRTSIQWPEREKALNQTPLVQGSLGFSQFRIKAAFDYQAFLVADITSFDFIMYNVRNSTGVGGDRLVANLDGDSVQVFCTSTSASQGLALYQAFLRLVQEKRTNYEASLKEIERFMKRKSVANPVVLPQTSDLGSKDSERASKSPLSLQTDVVVTLKAVNVGAFPSTFFDHQVFKLEALNATAKFAVAMDEGKIHSHLGLTLGQLRIGLAAVKGESLPKSLTEMSVEDVIANATGSRGGTILKVPEVQANMQTWHHPESTQIDYIFKSSFEGKVEVGWNYSRISFIRGMWASHSRALAQRLGKPLPPSAVKITGVPRPEDEDKDHKDGEQQKITAEVNMPQSKYEYTALEPPIIETPQLRDMGEATPPLEWIGLHRERLPNLTHQIVIVALLEVASEVEDAYAKILGNS